MYGALRRTNVPAGYGVIGRFNQFLLRCASEPWARLAHDLKHRLAMRMESSELPQECLLFHIVSSSTSISTSLRVGALGLK